MNLDAIGKWAFLIGIVIAIIVAFLPFMTQYAETILLILFVLGILVGFLNITEKDTVKFLVATVALLVVGAASLSAIATLGIVVDYVQNILGNFVSFVGAAVLVVSIKAIIETSQ